VPQPGPSPGTDSITEGERTEAVSSIIHRHDVLGLETLLQFAVRLGDVVDSKMLMVASHISPEKAQPPRGASSSPFPYEPSPCASQSLLIKQHKGGSMASSEFSFGIFLFVSCWLIWPKEFRKTKRQKYRGILL
jgi:hypothetical protein